MCEDTEKKIRQAWQDGYDDALRRVRNAVRMREMGFDDCEIVKRTGLPPSVVHALTGAGD